MSGITSNLKTWIWHRVHWNEGLLLFRLVIWLIWTTPVHHAHCCLGECMLSDLSEPLSLHGKAPGKRRELHPPSLFFSPFIWFSLVVMWQFRQHKQTTLLTVPSSRGRRVKKSLQSSVCWLDTSRFPNHHKCGCLHHWNWWVAANDRLPNANVCVCMCVCSCFCGHAVWGLLTVTSCKTKAFYIRVEKTFWLHNRPAHKCLQKIIQKLFILFHLTQRLIQF